MLLPARSSKTAGPKALENASVSGKASAASIPDQGVAPLAAIPPLLVEKEIVLGCRAGEAPCYLTLDNGRLTLTNDKQKKVDRASLYELLAGQIKSSDLSSIQLRALEKNVDAIQSNRSKMQQLADGLHLSKRIGQFSKLKNEIADAKARPRLKLFVPEANFDLSRLLNALLADPLCESSAFNRALMSHLNTLKSSAAIHAFYTSLNPQKDAIEKRLLPLLNPEAPYTSALEVPVASLTQAFSAAPFETSILKEAKACGLSSLSLERWVSRIPNYQSAVENFGRQELSTVQIGAQGADLLVDGYLHKRELKLPPTGIPPELKVPLICAAIEEHARAFGISPSDDLLRSAIGTLMSAAPINFNPVSTPKALIETLTLLNEDPLDARYYYPDARTQPQVLTQFQISANAKGALLGQVTTTRRFTFKDLSKGTTADVNFTAILERELLKSDAPFNGTLHAALNDSA